MNVDKRDRKWMGWNISKPTEYFIFIIMLSVFNGCGIRPTLNNLYVNKDGRAAISLELDNHDHSPPCLIEFDPIPSDYRNNNQCMQTSKNGYECYTRKRTLIPGNYILRINFAPNLVRSAKIFINGEELWTKDDYQFLFYDKNSKTYIKTVQAKFVVKVHQSKYILKIQWDNNESCCNSKSASLKYEFDVLRLKLKKSNYDLELIVDPGKKSSIDMSLIGSRLPGCASNIKINMDGDSNVKQKTIMGDFSFPSGIVCRNTKVQYSINDSQKQTAGILILNDEKYIPCITWKEILNKYQLKLILNWENCPNSYDPRRKIMVQSDDKKWRVPARNLFGSKRKSSRHSIVKLSNKRILSIRAHDVPHLTCPQLKKDSTYKVKNKRLKPKKSCIRQIHIPQWLTNNINIPWMQEGKRVDRIDPQFTGKISIKRTGFDDFFIKSTHNTVDNCYFAYKVGYSRSWVPFTINNPKHGHGKNMDFLLPTLKNQQSLNKYEITFGVFLNKKNKAENTWKIRLPVSNKLLTLNAYRIFSEEGHQKTFADCSNGIDIVCRADKGSYSSCSGTIRFSDGKENVFYLNSKSQKVKKFDGYTGPCTIKVGSRR